MRGLASGVTPASTIVSVVRRPSACSPTSAVTPPVHISSTIAPAIAATERAPRSQSMALTEACGHSSSAVRASAERPPDHARTPARPESPKSPPVSCTVANRPPSASKRAATARRANASRSTAIASSMLPTSRMPPRKITAPAPGGTSEATRAFTPRRPNSSTTSAASRHRLR
jgi:hypothetical protein